jgi:hypothetical protein
MKLLSTFSMNTLFATIAGLGLLAAAPLVGYSSLLQANAGLQYPGSTEQDRGSGRMASQDATVHAALVSWRGSGRIGADSESAS